MKGSRDRVLKLLNGEKTDRIPIYDLIPNDAVLKYFSGDKRVDEGDDKTAINAIANATDSSRWSLFSPQKIREEVLADGRKIGHERWTSWREHRVFSSSEEYRDMKKKELVAAWDQIDKMGPSSDEEWYKSQKQKYDLFGDDYCYLICSHTPGMMGMFDEAGLENFCYYLADCEDIIVEQLECNTVRACKWIENFPEDDPFKAIFIGEDIAFNGGPMFSPEWLRKEFFSRVRRITEAFHRKGKKVMYHSDGNLNPIMDMIVETGMDILNPIDVNAGMDLAELHRRYPGLFFAGGIDVTHLLPHGKPGEVKDAVVKAIEDTEGKILVGSSTEVTDIVPLENFLAMRQAAMDYRI